MLQWCKPNTGLPNPIGVHLGIIQTVESRTPLLLSAYPWGKCSCKIALMLKRLGNFETRGTYAFHSAQNSRSFRGNQMDWTILVWPGQNIKLVPYDWSCWSDWNVPFHFTNLLSSLLFFCILVTKWPYNNQMCGSFGRVCQTGVSVSLGK